MIKVKILKKRSDEVIEERLLDTLYDLEHYISRVTSTDIKYNNYHIEKTQKVSEFFKRTYYANFYVEFDDHIALVPLNMAQKRVKNYKKKTNSNKILENTLLRIQLNLNKEFRKFNIKPTVVMPRISKDRYEKIKITFDDKISQHVFEIEFDKILWEFKMVSVKTTKPQIIRTLVKIIRYTTTPTKVYREKHKVIQNENNVK